MTLNGIYWTAIVFGEVQGQLAVSAQVSTSPYALSTGNLTVTGQAIPPRAVVGDLWVSGAVAGQAASGPATAAGVLNVTGAVTTWVTPLGSLTVTGTATALTSIFGAPRSIVLPNQGNRVYPILNTIRTAFQGGKTPTRPYADEHGDPTLGAKSKIILPNEGNRAYPLLHGFRLSASVNNRYSDVVLFDAVGSAGTGPGSSWSWTHSVGSNASVLIVYLHFAYATSIGARTVKIGTTSLTNVVSLLTANNVSGDYTYVEAWALTAPPIGASQTMTVSVASGSALGFAANSVSYQNVSQLGTPITNQAESTSLSSGSVTAQAYQMISQMFGYGLLAISSLSAYSQTSRYSANSVSGQHGAVIIGDAPGGSPVNFTATGSNTDYWGSIAIPLLTSR